jgi:hypothetical protein
MSDDDKPSAEPVINELPDVIDDPPDAVETVMIDSGAFTLIERHAGYPNSDEECVEYVEQVGADYYVLRDYPVSAHTSFSRETPESMRVASVEVTHRCLGAHKRLQPSATPILVLQGQSPNDYIEHAQQFQSLPAYLGIGSMAYATPQQKLAVVRRVRAEFSDRRIHLFGAQVADFEQESTLFELLDSADSNKWDWNRSESSTWDEKAADLRDRQDRLRRARDQTSTTQAGLSMF